MFPLDTIEMPKKNQLADEPPEKFLFVHAVFEGLSAINEYHRDFVVELAAKITVGVDVDFLPGEAASSRELAKAFFHDFTEMTSFAGVHDDGSKCAHVGGILAWEVGTFPATKHQVGWLDRCWWRSTGTQ